MKVFVQLLRQVTLLPAHLKLFGRQKVHLGFILPMFFILSACGGGDRFTTAGDYHNMQGLWGITHTDTGYFEFVEFLADAVMHGQVSPTGEIDFIHVGGYHFHGLVAHSAYHIALDNDGYLTSIWREENFNTRLTADATALRLTVLGADGWVGEFNYLGQELDALDEAVGGALFFDETPLSGIVDTLWSLVADDMPEFNH